MRPSGKEDLSGRRFSMLVVLGRDGAKGGERTWLCKCDCGALTVVRSYCLRNGHTRSCGCIKKSKIAEVNRSGVASLTHGHARSRGRRSLTYSSWLNMVQRCTNPRNDRYKYYGARGVGVCETWLIFDQFLADMGERPSIEYCLCRNGDLGSYEPGNVKWGLKSTNTSEAASRPRRGRAPWKS
jgi:hypothetical protein